jgi:ATP-dependent DNA ligase
LIARALTGYTGPVLSLINPTRRPEPFDHPDWLFEAKFDGFRAAAAAVRGYIEFMECCSRTGLRLLV